MAIDFKTFASFINTVADAKHPVLIRGRHGVGKSETVYAFAKQVGKRVVERRASQMTEGDLVGLPVVDGNRTSWNPPDWFKDACDNPVVLFMDEIDRAVQEVRQGFFQLTDSRTINGHRLHPDTLIFAAVNGGAHGAQYAVNDMDPAELDRWTVFDLEPTVEDWVSFARKDGRVHDMIADFITDTPAHLEHKGEFEPNKKYPSRRSWVRFNDTVRSLLEREDYKAHVTALHNIGTGFLGFEAAIAFKDYVTNRENMMSPDDILVKGKSAKKLKITEQLALSDKIVATGRLNENIPQVELENFCKFLMECPSEAAMKIYTSASQHDFKFIVKMHKLTVNGKTMKTFVQGLLVPKK
jgi:hypothetical protein